MGKIRVPNDEELIQQIASGPEDTIECGVSCEDEYKDYLESQKEILVNILLSGKPLSELDRTEIAHLLCPELYLSEKTKPPGRPKGSETTRHRDFKITLEYKQLYQKGGSESAFVALQEKYGFKDRSSILKAINRVKKFMAERGQK